MACPLRLACRSTDYAVIARRDFFLLLSMCVCVVMTSDGRGTVEDQKSLNGFIA